MDTSHGETVLYKTSCIISIVLAVLGDKSSMEETSSPLSSCTFLNANNLEGNNANYSKQHLYE